MRELTKILAGLFVVLENICEGLLEKARSERCLVAAIDNLSANVTKLSATVDALIAKASQPSGVPEATVQGMADAVAAIDAKAQASLPQTP